MGKTPRQGYFDLYSKKVNFKIKIKFTITMGLIHFIGFVPLNTLLIYDWC